MKFYDVTEEIEAPPEKVWGILTRRRQLLAVGQRHRQARGPARWPHLRAHAGRGRDRVGRGHGLGASSPARLPLAHRLRSQRCDRGGDQLRRTGQRDDKGRHRAPWLGAAGLKGSWMARRQPGRLGRRAARLPSGLLSELTAALSQANAPLIRVHRLRYESPRKHLDGPRAGPSPVLQAIVVAESATGRSGLLRG